MANTDDEVPLAVETTEHELEERHEREEAELDEKCKAHLEATQAKAGKSKKSKEAVEAAEREVEQWQYELRERQKAEMEKFQEHLSSGPAAASVAEPEPSAAGYSASTIDAVISEEEKARKKKEKAQKKRQSRADKEAEREAEKERERLEAGPSRRETELAALKIKLAKQKPPMTILEIPADGNCLYRSIAHQIREFRPDLHNLKRSAEEGFFEVRALCADSLRKDSDQYSPFAELKDGEDFLGYCERVENSADWGGELELRALADALNVHIHVFRAEASEPLILGSAAKQAGEPLRVAFHQYYYALGEHYNSVCPIR
eukprot:TRINITY_DN107304_c0_g1_i1.p1 TRINITY_DN107304_c0_g1~~TRINITY_DN107304_c0_g1_i1.p1  ORF type:complete len:318 (+),score=90.99 TRINITY_DN107304_c0_g1_i1:47-1000(+)